MDPRRVLGIADDASLDEAEDAYHRLLLIHHPDLHHDADEAQRTEAERTTRLLNAAIEQLRAEQGTGTAAGVGATRSHRADAGTRARDDAAAGSPWGTWTTSTPGSSASGSSASGSASADAPPDDGEQADATAGWTWCPMCGAPVIDGDALRVHAADAHAIHLDHRTRPSKRRRRRRRGASGFSFLSPWALLPLNALAALVLALVVDRLTHDVMFARWVFGLAMAPTIIITLTRDRDR